MRVYTVQEIDDLKILRHKETISTGNRQYVIGNTTGYGIAEGLFMCCICTPKWKWTEDISKALRFNYETAIRIIHKKNCVKLIEVRE